MHSTYAPHPTFLLLDQQLNEEGTLVVASAVTIPSYTEQTI